MDVVKPLEFGHVPMTAERSNKIAQAAVAEAMAPPRVVVGDAKKPAAT